MGQHGHQVGAIQGPVLQAVRQLDIIEPPGPGEDAITLDVTAPPEELAAEIDRRFAQ